MDVFLKYYGGYKDMTSDGKHRMGMVMENCPYSLMDVITNYKNTGQSMPEEYLFYFVRNMCEGLKVIHQKKYAHLDIKPHNIFMSENGDFFKIADFNISQEL